MANVEIGKAVPTSKLAVNGDIRAKEIKVETTNWPDYVFGEDYELKSLSGAGTKTDIYLKCRRLRK